MKLKAFLLMLLTAICWGPNFLFIKVAVAEISPLTLVFLRVAIGTAVLFSITLFRKMNLWQWRHLWKDFVVMGLTMNVIPYTLISWGEVYISSALAGILSSLAIISIAIMAHYFGPHDPLTKTRVLGIFSGILGLVIIYSPILLHESLGNIFGTLFILIACLSYGVGTVYVRIHALKIPSLAVLTIQMICSTLILFFLTLFIERPYTMSLPSTDALLSIVLLGAIGTGISFIFYYKSIQIAGATYASLALFFVAIFAMLYGSIFLHEKITWALVIGTFFILAGLLGVNPALDKK